MESMARFLASGDDFTLANVKRHVALAYDEATAHVHPSGTFILMSFWTEGSPSASPASRSAGEC